MAHRGDSGEDTLVRSGAEAVHLAETLRLQLFHLSAVTVLAGALLSLWFQAMITPSAPLAVTVGVAILAGGFAVLVLLKPRVSYLWLLRGRLYASLPVVFSLAAILLTGPRSPSWWVAMPLLWVMSYTTSSRFVFAAAMTLACGYLGVTAAGGDALFSTANGGVIAAAIALPTTSLVCHASSEAFVKFAARLGLRTPPPSYRAPVRVHNLANTVEDPSSGGRSSNPPAIETWRPAGLTSRQLEVVFLAADGLSQREIASCLAISERQVERLHADARERAGAATTSQLVAIVVRQSVRLHPRPPLGSALSAAAE